MRKQASILCFLLAFGLLAAWFSMSVSDSNNAAKSTAEGFSYIHDDDTAGFRDYIAKLDERHTEEKVYGISGVVALIVALALWPRKNKTTA